jgi:hypothetical protein
MRETYRELPRIVAEHPWCDMYLLEDGTWADMRDRNTPAEPVPYARVESPHGEPLE